MSVSFKQIYPYNNSTLMVILPRSGIKREDVTAQVRIQGFHFVLLEKYNPEWAYAGIEDNIVHLCGSENVERIFKFTTLEKACVIKEMLKGVFKLEMEVGGYEEGDDAADELGCYCIPGILLVYEQMQSSFNWKKSSRNVKVPPGVLEGILAVRKAGTVNMFDLAAVKLQAVALDFPETADWIDVNPESYAEGVFEGFDAES